MDEQAFAVFVRRHQESVRRLLRRLTAGDHAWADDLAQETFIRAYKGLPSFDGRAKVSTWLFRIAFNVFLSSKAKPRPQPPVREETPERDPLLLGRLEKAMAVLKPEERASLTLAFVQGLTAAEIATVLDCPEGTVKTHLHRGKERLRAELGHE